MLKLRAKTLMLAKGIAKPHGFLTRTGVNTSTATKILRNDYKNIKLQHLELLCWFVGCTPNELFEWEPDKKFPDMPGHPCNKSVPKRPTSNFPNSSSA